MKHIWDLHLGFSDSRVQVVPIKLLPPKLVKDKIKYYANAHLVLNTRMGNVLEIWFA